MARAQQLVGGDEPGHAGADDDHAMPLALPGRKAVADRGEVAVEVGLRHVALRCGSVGRKRTDPKSEGRPRGTGWEGQTLAPMG